MSDTTATAARRRFINTEVVKKAAIGIFAALAALVLAVEIGWQLKDTGLLQPLAAKLASVNTPAAVVAAHDARVEPAPAAAVRDAQVIASPVVLDARKCGIKDYFINEIDGTITVKPDATCARLVTLADLERERAAGVPQSP